MTSSSSPGPGGTRTTTQASHDSDSFGCLASCDLAKNGSFWPSLPWGWCAHQAVEALVGMGVLRTPCIREAWTGEVLQQGSPKSLNSGPGMGDGAWHCGCFLIRSHLSWGHGCWCLPVAVRLLLAAALRVLFFPSLSDHGACLPRGWWGSPFPGGPLGRGRGSSDLGGLP